MPTGPTEWHEEWCNEGPTNSGDHNAINFLEKAGFELSKQWEWSHKDKIAWNDLTDKEKYAINYLIHEWDFGGLC